MLFGSSFKISKNVLKSITVRYIISNDKVHLWRVPMRINPNELFFTNEYEDFT